MITNLRTPWDPRAPPWHSGMTPRTSRTRVTEITTSNSSEDECYPTVMFCEHLILLSGACCQTFLNLMQSRKVLQQYQQIISQKLFQIIKGLLFFKSINSQIFNSTLCFYWLLCKYPADVRLRCAGSYQV